MDVASLYLVGRKVAMLAERAMSDPEGLPAEPDVERLVLRAVAERLVLRAVAESPGLTVGDLARKLSIAQSRISQVVAVLEREGLIQRSVDREDRRRQLIEPTGQFKRIIELRMVRGVEDALEPLLAHATAHERTRVLAAMEILHELVLRAEASGDAEP